MRIGRLAVKYQISIDSLYYYIKIGLLIPQQKGKQYFFDEDCENDLQLILNFKSWGFSLKEIYSILTLRRISNLQQLEDVQDVIRLMQNKYEQLQAEKEAIDHKQQHIREAQEHISDRMNMNNFLSGVPISMLSLLCCPDCGGQFQLSNTEMTQSHICTADVSCVCGYQAKIREGIFLTPHGNQSVYDRPDLEREFYKDLPADMISFYQRSYNWMSSFMSRPLVQDKVIIETHLNAYFFLQFQLQQLYEQNCRIILIDKFPEMLSLYKKLLDRQSNHLQVLYIADAGLNWPLCSECGDMFIDFFSSNEHQFYHHSNLIAEISPFLKSKSQILGTYFHINGSKSMANLLHEFPEACEDNFNLQLFQQNLLQLGYHFSAQSAVGCTVHSGNNWCFGFHADGEELSLLAYLAENSEDDRSGAYGQSVAMNDEANQDQKGKNGFSKSGNTFI